ncbi:hypothetical protein [Sphingobium sp. Sx8-8]|uniref:hypothetical protein n=1 Tax=Sphingobium sp. Sx8-8 TaxID=2933617 RepID=UPI001F570A89|nr:hypothetical protein [Sphingobium sp. Sx8-8]
MALARGRGFADAFGPAEGPTAHLLPIPPLIAGGVYSLLGVQSAPAEAVLLAWSLLLTFATYAFFAMVVRRLGASPGTSVAAFCFLCVAPVFTTAEAFDFRVWDGAITMATAGAFLILLLRADAGEAMHPIMRGLLSALPALLLFLQPIIGLAACVAWAQWLLRQRRAKALLATVTPFLFLLALLFGGWTARNMAAMGEPIWLRDNVGLELAVANHDAAVAPVDPGAVFQARLKQVHPLNGAGAYRAMEAAGGEIAYARKLGAETRSWMAAHPADAARIWMRHLREIMLPAPWQFRTANGHILPIVRAILVDITTMAGLAGLALLLRDRRRQALYLAPFIVLPILAYMPFQPILRYIWLIYAPLTCLAAYMIERTLMFVRRR